MYEDWPFLSGGIHYVDGTDSKEMNLYALGAAVAMSIQWLLLDSVSSALFSYQLKFSLFHVSLSFRRRFLWVFTKLFRS